jgi:AraC-like DNA-binding protein/mannose-6-phosphate isomerase-like protein (cupin superfamily)
MLLVNESSMMNHAAIQFYFQANDANLRLVRGTNVSHVFPCHSHDSFSFGLVQKGRRIIRIQGAQHVVSANDCFIINPHQPHTCRSEGDPGHDYGVISINPQLLHHIFRERTGKEGLPHFSQVKIADSSLANRFAAWLGKQTQDKPIDGEELTDLLGELVLRYSDENTAEYLKQTRHSVVTLASEYIEANLDKIVRLDEVAGVAHVSPFYLNRIFQKDIGVPPYAYLLQMRIKKSLELLLQTNSITEATYYLGFSDQSHFTRLFKRNVGITPKRYLDLHRTGTPRGC